MPSGVQSRQRGVGLQSFPLWGVIAMQTKDSRTTSHRADTPATQAHVERSAPHASARSAANMTSMLTPLELQRTAGNRATVALLRGFGSRPGIQRDVTDFKVSSR